MKKLKPKIFVSSTVKDLPNERAAAKKAIESLSAKPIMSEFTMGASDKPSVQACIDAVKKSDFYILVLGARYGWELENGISITELEYDTAYKEGIPIFVYNTEYEKEEKQEVFANKVGSQRFWKNVEDVFELEREIVSSFNQYQEEHSYQKLHEKETVTSNLIDISFPEFLYHAELSIDRTEVIEKSWDTEFPMKMNSAQYKVVRAALHQLELKAPGDWVLLENKLITFHDISDSSHPLAQIIDLGTVEKMESLEFYSTNDDYLRVFKALLKTCASRKLHHLGVRAVGSGLYAYKPKSDDLEKITISWKSKNEAKRTVFEAKMQKKDTSKMSYGKHLALRIRFYLIGENWYMAIVPEWFISFDGYRKSFYGHNQINYLKRNEKNAQVFNHLKFLVHELTTHKQTSLFQDYFNYKFLVFGKLQKVESYPKIDEKDWYKNENEKVQQLLIDSELPNLFND